MQCSVKPPPCLFPSRGRCSISRIVQSPVYGCPARPIRLRREPPQRQGRSTSRAVPHPRLTTPRLLTPGNIHGGLATARTDITSTSTLKLPFVFVTSLSYSPRLAVDVSGWRTRLAPQTSLNKPSWAQLLLLRRQGPLLRRAHLRPGSVLAVKHAVSGKSGAISLVHAPAACAWDLSASPSSELVCHGAAPGKPPSGCMAQTRS